MVKGLKMDRASNGLARVIEISEMKSGQSLWCEYCGTRVVFNAGYKRGDNIKVSPFLRLGPNASHLESCKNTFDSQIQFLASIGKDSQANNAARSI